MKERQREAGPVIVTNQPVSAQDIPVSRMDALLAEIRILEADVSHLESRKPLLQAQLHAAVAGLYDQVVTARQELLRQLERRMLAEPRNRRLQRDGVDLVFEMARDLEERFGADVREFTNRWGDTPEESSEGSEEEDFDWAREESYAPPVRNTVRKPGKKAAQDPEVAAKGIYRSLARELHPDKARDEGLREERTSLMQELTMAWQARDMGALLNLLHAHGSDDAKARSMDADTMKACLEGLEDRRRELAERFKSLRHKQLPMGVVDWLPLVNEPKLFEKLLRKHKAMPREELEFLHAVRAWWLRPGGLEECLDNPPQGLF